MNEDQPSSQAGSGGRSALVLTASDGAAAGARDDESGVAVAERLAGLGFDVERAVVPDDQPRIEAALRAAVEGHVLVVTTGGTGLTPRDVTPQATAAVIDYQVPGLAEAMRAEGRRHTPMADLSRAVAGVRGTTLIVNLPGSPRGAIESLEAIVPVLDHAIETLAGPFDHGAAEAASPAAVADGAEPVLPALADPRIVATPDEHE
jgi:molybdopterin adenylyltransferase